LLAATAVFGQLQYALNRVWRVKAAPRAALIMTFIKQRILSFALVLARRLLADGVVDHQRRARHAAHVPRRTLGRSRVFWSGLDLLISFTLATVLIAMLFKYLPDAENRMARTRGSALHHGRRCSSSASRSSASISGRRPSPSAFGAAASVVFSWLWVYYASADPAVRRRDHAGRRPRDAALIVVPTENAEPRRHSVAAKSELLTRS
jgi:membrane protein